MITGTTKQPVKGNINNVYRYIKSNEKSILNEQHSLNNYDLNLQVTTMLGKGISTSIGGAVFVAILSAIYKRNLKSGLAILGDLSIGGAIERENNFVDKIATLSENGAKNILVPLDNLSELNEAPKTIFTVTDIQFYSNSQMVLQKALLGE